MIPICHRLRRLLLITVSGHGSQVEDKDNEEDDGMDEGVQLDLPVVSLLLVLKRVTPVIWPSDIQYDPETQETSNYIVDDVSPYFTDLKFYLIVQFHQDLKRILIKDLPAGCRFTVSVLYIIKMLLLTRPQALLDCCHSGTGIGA